MALGLVSGALGIAKLIPDVIDLFSGKDEKSKGDVAKEVINLGSRAVETVTGKSYQDPQQIEEELRNNKEAQLELEKLYKNHKHELEVKYLEDVSDARNMYKKTENATTNKLASQVMTFNIVYVMAAVLAQIFCMFYLTEQPQLLVLIGNVVGIVVGNLLQERSQVLSFYFGSSMGSKMKDAVKDAFTKASTNK